MYFITSPVWFWYKFVSKLHTKAHCSDSFIASTNEFYANVRKIQNIRHTWSLQCVYNSFSSRFIYSDFAYSNRTNIDARPLLMEIQQSIFGRKSKTFRWIKQSFLSSFAGFRQSYLIATDIIVCSIHVYKQRALCVSGLWLNALPFIFALVLVWSQFASKPRQRNTQTI